MDLSNPLAAWTVAPVFSQPILPGWTINVNSYNSTSPRTEGLVVSRFSYGQQLGRIADALAAIVETLPAETRAKQAVKDFMALKAAIDVLKDAV